MTNYHICPNCSAAWGIEEISFQECDACGYPNPEKDSEFGDGFGDEGDLDLTDFEEDEI